MLVVVTGTPGVGKSTIAQLLASRLDALHIDLSRLIVEERLIAEQDSLRETQIADIEKTIARVNQLLEHEQRTVIVGGHFASDIMVEHDVKYVFILRRDPWELKRELESRDYGSRKVWENVMAEVLGVCLSDAVSAFGELRLSEIDVTRLAPEEVVQLMVSVVDSGVPIGIGKVDWLSLPGIEVLCEEPS